MLTNHQKHLEIIKGQLWELWLITPSKETFLGAFNTLEELSQVQATIYNKLSRISFIGYFNKILYEQISRLITNRLLQNITAKKIGLRLSTPLRH